MTLSCQCVANNNDLKDSVGAVHLAHKVGEREQQRRGVLALPGYRYLSFFAIQYCKPQRYNLVLPKEKYAWYLHQPLRELPTTRAVCNLRLVQRSVSYHYFQVRSSQWWYVLPGLSGCFLRSTTTCYDGSQFPSTQPRLVGANFKSSTILLCKV